MLAAGIVVMLATAPPAGVVDTCAVVEQARFKQPFPQPPGAPSCEVECGRAYLAAEAAWQSLQSLTRAIDAAHLRFRAVRDRLEDLRREIETAPAGAPRDTMTAEADRLSAESERRLAARRVLEADEPEARRRADRTMFEARDCHNWCMAEQRRRDRPLRGSKTAKE